MKPLFPPTVMADLLEPDTCEVCGRYDDDPCEDCARGPDHNDRLPKFVSLVDAALWWTIVFLGLFQAALIITLLALIITLLAW